MNIVGVYNVLKKNILLKQTYTTIEQGWYDGRDSLEVRTLASKPSSLGLNPDTAVNCRPGASQAG